MHTEKSIRLLAEQAGLRVASVEYDSTAFQFEASELYLRDVPLNDQAGKTPPAEHRAYARRARELNRTGRGDQAAIYLERA
ncbi:MAG TPA: hypothetical protein VE913_10340, partial [Longimicrobium sp.]|nr:hypothetical protein [Longimicrobium sp.]